jgi:hypothetical protein
MIGGVGLVPAFCYNPGYCIEEDEKADPFCPLFNAKIRGYLRR